MIVSFQFVDDGDIHLLFLLYCLALVMVFSFFYCHGPSDSHLLLFIGCF